MKIIPHSSAEGRIAEIISDEVLITNADDALQLLADLYYQDFVKVVIREQNLAPGFFDLKNGMAGDILQKFSNYRFSLAVIGDFSRYQGKSIRDFIYESNKGRLVNFLDSPAAAFRA
ncbi:DUF4180 domain-containing protein [Pedobacter yulinensis]|uniref:DUF4180 domain-containing protein n=1 Tax=Pedobacter yulinensis TaxID=2126353 RepID=A0A2T3HPD9_9SPHI|nr:DUF4180 domain-containing protein [Pedobacter yulinensis]PST84318.1 DUF4180 domain-containing protein [Pedobacter yulinensis]